MRYQYTFQPRQYNIAITLRSPGQIIIIHGVALFDASFRGRISNQYGK